MNPTVSLLFRRLEESGVRYVLLRNYEQLCDTPAGPSEPAAGAASDQATDIDLVIATEDIPKWRTLAVSLARDCHWDALTECGHFTQSRRHEHHIEIFRFYEFSEGRFLQVDLFHAYLVWGVPLMTERDMLEGRLQDPLRGLTRLDPLKENVFRLLQLNGLVNWKHSGQKVTRYRDRVLNIDGQRRDEFRDGLNSRFPGSAGPILEALEKQDWPVFRKLVRSAKAGFFLR